MHKSINNLISIETELKSKLENYKKIKIIAVSKTFQKEDILPLLNHGHINYGENKIQEAIEKWSDIKNDYPNIKLHMIGKLQSNKVKFVIPLFDYIHSLDNEKLAKKISSEQKKFKKKLKIFIQINIGNEDQKNGINPTKLKSFYETCTKKFNLNIIGLMCLPPIDSNSIEYFKTLKNLANKFDLKHLSMGMSSDYENAVYSGSTYLRLGTSIMGPRD